MTAEERSSPTRKQPPRPFPAGLRWVCRIFGGLFLCGFGFTLAITGLAVWSLTSTPEGLFGQSMEVLSSIVGRLVGALFMLLLAIWLFRRSSRKSDAVVASVEPAKAPIPEPAFVDPGGKTSSSRLRSACNIFQAGSDKHRVWHFDLKGRRYVARGEEALPAGRPLPAGVAGKGWRSLVQPRLNVAWLPAQCVFLRVVQLPQCAPEELAAMVELQLEKLSPLPINQIVWNAHVLGQGEAGLQTVLVVMAELDAAEAFLGKLEESGLFVDRLDVPAVDQLMTLKPAEDGAWILPDLTGVAGKALVGWWFGGVLRNLALLELPTTGNPGIAVRDQLRQMAWAGEIEGWLTQTPRWHLVAGPDTRGTWLSALKAGLKEEVQGVDPIPPAELALSCANRSARAGALVRGLLPEEYATRYRQQINDRLWMRSLGGVLALYMTGVLVYFAVLGAENWRFGSVAREVRQLGPAYTNAMDLKATFEVLNDLQELKYAALDCWEYTAQLIPEGVVLDGLNFSEGSKLTLNGTAPEDAVGDLIDFSDALRNFKVDGKPVFRPAEGAQLSYKKSPRTDEVKWNFSLVLKRSEVR